MKVILFDGYCNLCNGLVNFVIKNTPPSLYTFIPLDSKQGQYYLKKHNFSCDDFDTIILIQNTETYTASRAALEIVKNFTGLLRYLYILRFIPLPISDFIYKIIAKNRYRFFGKRNTCHIE